jgi:hypothetical protein
MSEGSNWRRFASWAGVSILVAFPALAHAQVVQNRTIEFPGGGTKNDNRAVGPFCCTGETAIIHDVEGKPAGYIYFYDFSGAINIGANQSAVSTVGILISSASTQTMFPSARFAAETWVPGTTVMVELEQITYEVTINPQLLTIDGHKYFDMSSLKATVRVSSKPTATASTLQPEPSPTEAEPTPVSSIDDAAYEFVSEAMPITDFRRLNAQSGSVLPSCNMEYPNTGTNIDDTEHYPAPEISMQIRLGVDSAYIKQNLIAAGVPEATASQILQDYREDRAKFDALSYQERKQLEDNRSSPDWRLVQSLDNLGIAGLPQFKDPIRCQPVAYLKVITPYRFTLSPGDGRMFIIPRFSFQVCKRSNLDPYSRANCDNWVEVGSGQKAKVAGRYAYSAEWPDGRVTRDIMDFAVDGTTVHEITVTAPQN